MCDEPIVDTTVVSTYMNYKKAIRTGLADTAKTLKFEYIDKLFHSLMIGCNGCGVINACNSGCDYITPICSPTIKEYNEIKSCKTHLCISITDVTQ